MNDEEALKKTKKKQLSTFTFFSEEAGVKSLLPPLSLSVSLSLSLSLSLSPSLPLSLSLSLSLSPSPSLSLPSLSLSFFITLDVSYNAALGAWRSLQRSAGRSLCETPSPRHLRSRNRCARSRSRCQIIERAPFLCYISKRERNGKEERPLRSSFRSLARSSPRDLSSSSGKEKTIFNGEPAPRSPPSKQQRQPLAPSPPRGFRHFWRT